MKPILTLIGALLSCGPLLALSSEAGETPRNAVDVVEPRVPDKLFGDPSPGMEKTLNVQVHYWRDDTVKILELSPDSPLDLRLEGEK